MQKIETYKTKIEKELQLLDFSLKPVELFEPIEYILSLGGKRLRPILTLLGAELFGGDVTQSIPQALAIEIFHNFTLLHDDIMDNAPLRRGSATVHEKWNSNIAILSGDAMLIIAQQQLCKSAGENLPLLLDEFNKTALEVCIGQQYDMNFEDSDVVSIDDYIEMITLKTSVLLGCALKLGAIQASASEKEANLIYQFGKNIGIAFQLQDDILDVYADPEKFGKQVGGDIIANKKTYLLLKAFEDASTDQKAILSDWMAKETFDKQQKVDAIKSIYTDLDIKQKAESLMEHYFQKGMHDLAEIKVDDRQKETLVQLAKSLMIREV